MISDDALRRMLDQVTGPAENPAGGRRSRTVSPPQDPDSEFCECDEACRCDPCPCDVCDECGSCGCCCICDEDVDCSCCDSDECEDCGDCDHCACCCVCDESDHDDAEGGEEEEE